METKQSQDNQSGFALLMALLVVGVVLTVGLSVLELSIKQVQLATTARDSEIAFHAANAGMECSRYIRRLYADEMENGNPISPSCFGVVAPNTNTYTAITNGVTGDGEVTRYDYSFTWGTDGDRCTEVTALVASSTLPGTGLAISNMTTLFPGFSNGDTKNCEAGTRCTVMAVRGYNRPCNSITNYGTVQREVLLQF